MSGHGDLNNTHAARPVTKLAVDPAYSHASLAIPAHEDDPAIRQKYRPFLLDPEFAADDWVAHLELSTALRMVQTELLDARRDRLRILVLYGSLRARSYSRLLAFEAARILFRLGCDVRVYNPAGLPQKDDVEHGHDKVQELRELSRWSDGHVWVSPEQHGNLVRVSFFFFSVLTDMGVATCMPQVTADSPMQTGIFKQQIDWIPLSSGSVRPTQGRTLAIAQVSGGSQSFNAVNSLRILGRWMRMFAIPNQSSVPKAYTQFTGEAEGSRMMASPNRDRLVDCMEELVKYTIVMRPHFDLFGDRFSEREEGRAKAEKETGAPQ